MPSYIEMPKLSDTMTEGTVVKWRKAVGDAITLGDVVAEVETDKAVMELEAFGEGALAEIYVQEGQKARIGEKLAMLAAPGEAADPAGERLIHGQAPADSAPADAKSPAAVGSPEPRPDPEPARTGAGPVTGTAAPARIKASPLARKLAAARGLDLAGLTGSGPGGRIIARDIESYSEPAPQAATPSGAAPISVPAISPHDRRVSLSGMRKIIADRLVASKTQIPHFYLHLEADVAELTRLRAQANTAMEKAGGGRLSINDFVLRAAVLAATRVPRANASFAGDAIIEHAEVHLAVAVAIEEGLVTPVIRQAQNKTLRQISEAVKDLAARARAKRLKPDEYQGGTLTVTNLGAYGVESFSAIINPPQAIILSIGAITKRPVVNRAGEIVAGERMSIGLSADHRVVDGAIGAEYLAQLREFLENPTLLLL